jgi:hypothetical protein
MSPPQGLVSYPGLTTFTRAEYVLSQGISPGKCTLEMPQELLGGLQRTGDLTFSYGSQSITLSGCVVDQAHIASGEGGFMARVDILDRRWQWAEGYLSGHWNLRMPSGACADEGFNTTPVQVQGDATKIRQGTEKAPQDIASACLDAMGEENYDVSALPNDSRPEIAWSHVNAAKALQELCEGLGCRVVYVIDSDSVQIVTIGEGNGLPQNPAEQWVSAGMNPPETPSALTLVGGPIVWQGFLPLEAVGIDTDGSVKPIALLSYCPAKGWSSDPKYATITDPTLKSLAEKCIYKMWRITSPIQVPTTANVVNTSGAPPTPMQVKLYDRLLDTHNDPNDSSRIIHKKPEVWGYFKTGHNITTVTPTTNVVYKEQIEVDENRWLIITPDALTRTVQQKIQPANIQVKIAYSLRDPTTLEPYRFTLTRPLDSGLDTQAEEIHRDEIYLKVVGQFDNNFNLTGATDNANADNLAQEANYYLDAAQSQYVEKDTLDVPYVGIIPIQVDGLIEQVTYSISGSGTLTRASLATEHNPYVMPYKRRRMLEDHQEQAKAFNRAKRDLRLSRNKAMPGCD